MTNCSTGTGAKRSHTDNTFIRRVSVRVDNIRNGKIGFVIGNSDVKTENSYNA